MTKNPTTFALRGAVCFSTDSQHLTCLEDAYIVCRNGRTVGVFPELPAQFHGIPCQDFSNYLIIPGMNDLHLHAPQYAFHGMYMDLELLDWLNTVTFPEESRYSDLDYAAKAYSIFAEDLKKSATTRASIFGTLHVAATEPHLSRKKVLLFQQRIPSAGSMTSQENTRMSNLFSPHASPLPVQMNS